MLPGMDVVFVNMDETPIFHECLAPPGNVVRCTRREMRRLNLFYQRVCRSRLRKMSTLAAFTCSDPALQPYMPQILLPKKPKGGNAIATAAEHTAFAALPAPMEVWMGSTGWNNNRIMCHMITRMRSVIYTRRPHTGTIVLIVDSCPSHVHWRVLQHCARLNIILLLIPGQLTWLLQVLDAVVFRTFKSMLRTLLMRAREQSPTGALQNESWIPCLAEAVMAQLVHRDWSAAFAAQGITTDFRALSPRVCQIMLSPVETLEALGAEPLTDAEISLLVGRRRIDIARHFSATPQRLRERHLHAHLALPAPAPETLPLPMVPRGSPLPGIFGPGRGGLAGKGGKSGRGRDAA